MGGRSAEQRRWLLNRYCIVARCRPGNGKGGCVHRREGQTRGAAHRWRGPLASHWLVLTQLYNALGRGCGALRAQALVLHLRPAPSCLRLRLRAAFSAVHPTNYFTVSTMAAAEGTALAKVAALLEERAYDQLGTTLDEAELEVRRSGV